MAEVSQASEKKLLRLPRWGVMFNDGSVSYRWNGRTEREQASAAAAAYRDMYPGDNITLAHRTGRHWERVDG